jgi:serine/threonine-protein kinase
MLFRTKAVLERLAPAEADLGRQHTAPLITPSLDAAPLGPAALEAVPLTPVGPRAPVDDFQDPLEMEPLVALLDPPPGRGTGRHDTGDLQADPDDDILRHGDDAGSHGGDGDDETSDASGDGRRRRKLLRPGRIVLLLVILLSVAAGLIGWKLATRSVAVPAVLGKSPAAAETALRGAHLKSHVDAVQVYSETAPKGTVAATNPAVGHDVSRGTDVALKLSLGPERYAVPTLTKLSVADANAALRVSHLRAGKRSDAYSDTVPSGAVISTSPAAGEQLKPDTPVDYVVSKGPAPVTVPKLSELTGDAAQQALTKLGLKVTVTQEFSETVPVGRVIGLSPSNGLHRMQAVTLSVSKGPQLVQIPANIKSYNPANAKNYLEQLGLRVATVNLPGLDSRVIGVDPDPGAMVKVGATVTLILI